MYQLDGASRRVIILEAAVYVAGCEGEQAVTVEAVADQAGLSPEAVSEEFASGADMLAEIPDFLDCRMSEYMVEAARHLPEGNSGGDVLMQLAEAYFAYAQDEPDIYHYLFERYDAMDEERVCQFAKGEKSGTPGADMALNVVKRFAEEQGAVVAADGDISPLEIGRITLALWSLIHGMGHLSVVGILRLQHAVIRAANLKQVDRLVVDALQYWFKNKQIPQRRPIMNDARGIVEKVMGSEREKPFVAPDNLEQMDPEEAKKVIIEAALRVAGRNGVDRRFFDHVAEKLGTSKDFLTTIVDNDFALREVAETLTTTEMAKIFEACLAELPDDTPTVDRLQIVAAAYFNYAMMYPERFSSIIALASGSVVPHNGDGSSHEGMTKNFAIMMDLLRKFVIEMGITPTDQLVYISTLAVWAGANGIAHLCSIGDFKSFNEDLKWALFIQVVTVSFFAIAHGLQILGHENEEFKQV